MGSGDLRSRFPAVERSDVTAIKRRAFSERGVLAVEIDHPALTTAEREILRSIGSRLYGFGGARPCA